MYVCFIIVSSMSLVERCCHHNVPPVSTILCSPQNNVGRFQVVFNSSSPCLSWSPSSCNDLHFTFTSLRRQWLRLPSQTVLFSLSYTSCACLLCRGQFFFWAAKFSLFSKLTQKPVLTMIQSVMMRWCIVAVARNSSTPSAVRWFLWKTYVYIISLLGGPSH